jgi:hypothetical protein
MSQTASKAAGAYLRRLREARRMGRPTIANTIRTSENQVKRIEDGAIDSRGSLWMAFCHAVHGSAADLEYLMSHPDLTAADGQRLAQEWINAQTNPLTDEECQSMQDMLKQWIANQPDLPAMSADEAAQWQSSLAMLRRILRPPSDTPAV